MLLNRGVFRSNKPPFAKLIRGMFTHAGESGVVRQTGLTSPVSSASRNRLRLRNGKPPQEAASYWLKYQPQVGRRWAGCDMFLRTAQVEVDVAHKIRRRVDHRADA